MVVNVILARLPIDTRGLSFEPIQQGLLFDPLQS